MGTEIRTFSLLEGWPVEQSFLTEHVSSVRDISCPLGSRVRVNFKNGYALSVVKGQGTYGDSLGLFEIAPINTKDCLDGSLLDEKDQGDDVLGYCNLETIAHYVKKLALL